MSKLRRDLRIATAGACSGLFSVSLYLLGARVVAYYEYLSFRRANGYAADYYSVEDLWWVPLVAWHVILSILASLLMHRYLATSRVSTFVRWQAISVVGLTGWALTAFLAIGIECLVRGTLNPIEYAFNMFKLVPVAQFVAAVFASNVLYGSAVQVAAAESLNESTHDNLIEA